MTWGVTRRDFVSFLIAKCLEQKGQRKHGTVDEREETSQWWMTWIKLKYLMPSLPPYFSPYRKSLRPDLCTSQSSLGRRGPVKSGIVAGWGLPGGSWCIQIPGAWMRFIWKCWSIQLRWLWSCYLFVAKNWGSLEKSLTNEKRKILCLAL